jgi:ferrous iron transport protein A
MKYMGGEIMPLTMLPMGKEAIINVCNAKESTKKFLEGLGLIPGASISIVSEMSGNLIVNIKGARVALNRGIAQQLLVKAC